MTDLYRLLSLQALKLSTMRRMSFSERLVSKSNPLGLRPSISDALKDVLSRAVCHRLTGSVLARRRLLFGLAMRARPSRSITHQASIFTSVSSKESLAP